MPLSCDSESDVGIRRLNNLTWDTPWLHSKLSQPYWPERFPLVELTDMAVSFLPILAWWVFFAFFVFCFVPDWYGCFVLAQTDSYGCLLLAQTGRYGFFGMGPDQTDLAVWFWPRLTGMAIWFWPRQIRLSLVLAQTDTAVWLLPWLICLSLVLAETGWMAVWIWPRLSDMAGWFWPRLAEWLFGFGLEWYGSVWFLSRLVDMAVSMFCPDWFATCGFVNLSQ